jgi:modification methylase
MPNQLRPGPAQSPQDPMPITSVWLTCQQPAGQQRKGRYVPASRAHPAKMLPAIAAHAIACYTTAGDTVLDPMCGSGTTLAEAVRAGRHAIGVDIEPPFAAIAEANLRLATQQGATGHGQVITGDATRLPQLLPPEVHGHVALVLTSPPYGSVTHGQVQLRPGAGILKAHARYGPTGHGNLAYAGWNRLLEGFTEIMNACTQVLRPGGIVAITSRPVRRRRDDFIDLPSHVLAAATAAGLEPLERCVALLAAVREDQIIHRASVFALLAARRARKEGTPVSLVAHEDVHILRKP